ncbi:MAG: APC family permease [Bacillota bacterium]
MNNKLHTTEIFAIILGAIIGMGSFILPGSKFLPTAGVINTTIGLFIGTMCIVVIERSYRFMMSCEITEGGEFSFANMCFGDRHSFVVGWFLFLAYMTLIPLNASAFPIVLNYIFPDALNFGYLYTIAGDAVYIGEVLVSTLLIALFATINLVGVKSTGKVQKYIIYCMVISIFVVFVAMMINADFAVFNTNYVENYTFDFSAVLVVIAVTPFLFIGFDAIPQLVKDLGVSKRKASAISVVALLFGMMIYMILNFMTGLAYSPSQASTFGWALGSGVMENVGAWAFVIITIAIACAVSAGINGFMVCSQKLIGSMARSDVMPNFLSKQNKYGVNKNTIYFVSIIGCCLCLFGREVVVWIVDMCSFGAGVAYFYVCLGTVIKSQDKVTKFFGVAGIVISVGVLLLLVLPFSPAKLSLAPMLFLIAWIIAGAVIGFFIFKNKKVGNKKVGNKRADK